LRERNTTGRFRFDEARYYRFGVGLGIANLVRNKGRLGLRKTLGKILQPINSYTRFPEYQFIDEGIRQCLLRFPQGVRPKILDIGSPKCMGLYLANCLDAEVHLTDIDKASVEEAKVLWRAILAGARGNALHSIQDGRSLQYPNQEFDVVFSMSVIEHVGGSSGDAEVIREAIRVLKPGGILLITVPIGQKYVEQEIVGFEGAARSTGDRSSYFFQRIYSPDAVTDRIIARAKGATLRKVVTICRSEGIVAGSYKKLGMNVRGMLGFLNPYLSATVNHAVPGVTAAPSRYGSVHSASDVYGDLLLAWEKDGVEIRSID